MNIAEDVSSNATRQAPSEGDRAARAAWLWRRSQALQGTAGEHYFRQVRGISAPLPDCLRYLPAWRDHPHAVITAFGVSPEQTEIEGHDRVTARAVHLTALESDGSARLYKRMVGLVSGLPLILKGSSAGDTLYICEGIEDGLSLLEATDGPVWAAGSASFLPKLAPAVSRDVGRVIVVADGDPQGTKMARRLLSRLSERAISAEIAWLDGPPVPGTA